MPDCLDCRFFRPDDPKDEYLGTCRRRSPVVVIKHGCEEPMQNLWPPVSADSWCGEFEAKEPPK